MLVKDDTAGVVGREYDFSDQDFEIVREKLYAHAGIALSDYKKDMVYNRLIRRVRALSLSSFAEYFFYLERNSEEFSLFINSLTTNLTAFFREGHHFEFLKNVILPEVDANESKRLRIWSAGCSMGEEPYSLAMACLTSAVDVRDWDIKVLATDIDSAVLHTAKTGVYALDRIESIAPEIKTCFFRKGIGAHSGMARVKKELRQLITFKELNLMHSWPMTGPLDVIFCRNVMIYFDKATQAALLERMANILKPGGFLFVGHSESPFRLTKRFKLIGHTIYQRVS